MRMLSPLQFAPPALTARRVSPRLRRHGHAIGQLLLEATLIVGTVGALAAGTFVLR